MIATALAFAAGLLVGIALSLPPRRRLRSLCDQAERLERRVEAELERAEP